MSGPSRSTLTGRIFGVGWYTVNPETKIEQKVERPNPGSVEAREQGCKCPVLDNAHGLGAWGSRGDDAVFVVRDGCPVHPFFEAAGS